MWVPALSCMRWPGRAETVDSVWVRVRVRVRVLLLCRDSPVVVTGFVACRACDLYSLTLEEKLPASAPGTAWHLRVQ